MKLVALALALCATAVLVSACGDGHVSTQRVVVANTSLVDTVMALVPQERIAAIPQQALTWSFGAAAGDAEDDLATFPAFTAETVLGFAPDLVLCSVHSLPETVASLQAAGVRTVRFDFPTGLADSAPHSSAPKTEPERWRTSWTTASQRSGKHAREARRGAPCSSTTMATKAGAAPPRRPPTTS